MIDYIDSEEIVQQFLCSYVISDKNVIYAIGGCWIKIFGQNSSTDLKMLIFHQTELDVEEGVFIKVSL